MKEINSQTMIVGEREGFSKRRASDAMNGCKTCLQIEESNASTAYIDAPWLLLIAREGEIANSGWADVVSRHGQSLLRQAISIFTQSRYTSVASAHHLGPCVAVEVRWNGCPKTPHWDRFAAGLSHWFLDPLSRLLRFPISTWERLLERSDDRFPISKVCKEMARLNRPNKVE